MCDFVENEDQGLAASVAFTMLYRLVKIVWRHHFNTTKTSQTKRHLDFSCRSLSLEGDIIFELILFISSQSLMYILKQIFIKEIVHLKFYLKKVSFYTMMLMESQMWFIIPLNISGASKLRNTSKNKLYKLKFLVCRNHSPVCRTTGKNELTFFVS